MVIQCLDLLLGCLACVVLHELMICVVLVLFMLTIIISFYVFSLF
jgi:hypothetical protein